MDRSCGASSARPCASSAVTYRSGSQWSSTVALSFGLPVAYLALWWRIQRRPSLSASLVVLVLSRCGRRFVCFDSCPFSGGGVCLPAPLFKADTRKTQPARPDTHRVRPVCGQGGPGVSNASHPRLPQHGGCSFTRFRWHSPRDRGEAPGRMVTFFDWAKRPWRALVPKFQVYQSTAAVKRSTATPRSSSRRPSVPAPRMVSSPRTPRARLRLVAVAVIQTYLRVGQSEL